MRYFALATDYDGTLARDGAVSHGTVLALERLRSSGRKLILVTGRRLPDLLDTFGRIDLFDIAVVENGAVLYRPETKEEVVLAAAPHPALAGLLHKRGVAPLAAGHVVVATTEAHKQTVLDTILELGLELQIVFNKGAVMILPAGVNKATGLAPALDEIGLSAHNVVGVGDAENDHAFLTACECGVAVHNALGSLMEQADFVTRSDHGEGVVELIDHLLDNDLADIEPKLSYRNVVLGKRLSDSSEVLVPAYGVNVLVAGSQRSAIVTAFLAGLSEAKYQFLAIGPAGAFSDLEAAVTLGDAEQSPTPGEVMSVLDNPKRSVIVASDEIRDVDTLITRVKELRVRTGRPHWIVMDSPHDLGPGALVDLKGILMMSPDPSKVAGHVLAWADLVIAAGDEPEAILSELCRAAGEEPTAIPPRELEAGEVLLWSRTDGSAPVRFRFEPASLASPLHI